MRTGKAAVQRRKGKKNILARQEGHPGGLVSVEVVVDALHDDGGVPDVVQVHVVTLEGAFDVVASAITRKTAVKRLVNITNKVN
jgi:hypothetical protein